MKKPTQAGFTLYELLITVLIVGVVLTLGIPNMTEFTRNSRITTTANDLHAAFLVARAEAARAKTNITICASDNSMTAGANCQGGWDDGFIVFVDDNGDRTRAGIGETVLRAHPAIAEGVSLAVANDATFFTYTSAGLGSGVAGSVSQVIVCDARGVAESSKDYSAGRLLVATPLGRATVLRDYTLVSNALAGMGKTCP
ncbi:MAG: GspH/FimT family pseudopilin [Gammaproteobacteria bacterium]|nr:GspH/FimT family pseudopilin [Gammaproteobacteria bacterium]MDH5304212.1 GspH/FimT family pseudopilin [Gammaproteobacteria bacterium]